MNINVEISVLSDAAMGAMGIVNSVIMGKTAQAVEAGARLIETNWKGYAMGDRLPDGRAFPANPGLAASIVSAKVDPYHWMVSSSHPDAERAEAGSPPVDMKDPGGPWLSGRKSRVSADGTPYLIIPFRHTTPGASGNAMPRTVYNALRAQIREGLFKKSDVARSAEQNIGIKESENARGEMVPRASYNWGSALVNVVEAFPSVLNADRLEGMYAFDTSSGKQSRSSYVTFRVLSAKSREGSWIQPAKPGFRLAQTAAEEVKAELGDLIEAALKIDLGGLE